jgi:hypothetical protein
MFDECCMSQKKNVKIEYKTEEKDKPYQVSEAHENSHL